MTEALKPCPCCGSSAEFVRITDGENIGGHCIACTGRMCGLTTDLMFSLMEDCKPILAERWNRRAGPDDGYVTCDRCNGSGDQEYLVGGGPDAHDEIGPCSKCGGVGATPAPAQPEDWKQPHPPSRHCMCPSCIPSFDERFEVGADAPAEGASNE